MAKARKENTDHQLPHKAPPLHATGDPWFDALMNFVEFNEAEPLTVYLEAMADSIPAAARQLRELAQLLRFLSARSRGRPVGKPSGALQRPQNPNYVAAWFAENWIANWKRDNAGQNIPDETREEFIARAVAKINTWHFAKRRKAEPERVRELLRGTRKRRL